MKSINSLNIHPSLFHLTDIFLFKECLVQNEMEIKVDFK